MWDTEQGKLVWDTEQGKLVLMFLVSHYGGTPVVGGASVPSTTTWVANNWLTSHWKPYLIQKATAPTASPLSSPHEQSLEYQRQRDLHARIPSPTPPGPGSNLPRTSFLDLPPPSLFHSIAHLQISHDKTCLW